VFPLFADSRCAEVAVSLLDVPKFDVPTLDVPKFDVPTLDVPKSLFRFSMCRLSMFRVLP
jgi:hypothetical protein